MISARLTSAFVGLFTLAIFTQSLSAATLLHHWPVDEGSGALITDVVSSADMTISGSTTGWTTGKVGAAFEFDGSNYAISATDALSLPSSGSVAVAFWFKTGSGLDRRDVMVDFEDLYTFRINSDDVQVTFTDNIGSSPRYGAELDDGLWHHVVAQNDGSSTSVYIDGEFAGSYVETADSLTTKSRESAIGARRNGGNAFEGAIDDVRFYDGLLMLSEIQSLAQIADQPPVAQDDAYSDAVDTQLAVAAPGVLANDSDPDGDTLSASLVVDVAQGTLNLSSDGSFTYDPPSGFVGIVSFTYQAIDVDGSSNIATVEITILDPASSISPAEIAQIENDLGITLSSQEILDLSSIVKPQSLPTWRSDANLRIEDYRKADLTVEVVDSQGTPVPGAEVQMELLKNEFNFSGVVTVQDLTDANNDLSNAGSTTDDWKRVTKALFNTLGLNNGFKPKITGQHEYIPGFMSWAQANDLDVRGHLLIWPGGGDVETMDTVGSVSGTDYGSHLSTASTSDYASYDVLGGLETYKASARTQADKDALEAVIDDEIEEWVGQWDVYEWDVINETVSNQLLMEILGYDQMAEWFKIADANKFRPGAKLFINDFQIASAKFTGTSYTTRRDTYFNHIDQIIADGGPVDGIGFQSRFKFLDDYDPAIVYARIEEFATRYPGLDISGTEFEVKDNYNFTTGDLVEAYDETTRAQVTEEIMTTYYSHDQVTGLSAWDFMNPQPAGTDDAYSRALVYYGDGPGGVAGPIVKLNALVWYYLHRIRYHTDVIDSTEANGEVVLRGFKGEYDITVSYGGNDYPASYTLLADGSTQIQLNDVTVIPSAPTEATIEHWPFDDVADTELPNTLNVSGTTQFFGASSTIVTDGSGLLVISQDGTKASGGNFLGSSDVTIGARSTGKYELELIIDSVVLTGGDANGANFGLGFKDSAAGGDLFRIRLNKTTGGLAVNTFFDSTYTGFHTFTGLFSLTEPLKLRVVIDLDTDLADIYMTEGAGTETLLGQIATASGGVWDQLSFSAVNNTTDWGVSDVIKLESIKIRKLELDNYGLWEARTDWMGETLTAQTDDPDGDKVINLLEYALGGDPLINDASAVLPTLAEFEGAPHYQFTLGVDTPDLILSVQHSIDLIDWDTLAPTVIHGEAGQFIQFPLLAPGLDKRFSRLSVSEN